MTFRTREGTLVRSSRALVAHNGAVTDQNQRAELILTTPRRPTSSPRTAKLRAKSRYGALGTADQTALPQGRGPRARRQQRPTERQPHTRAQTPSRRTTNPDSHPDTSSHHRHRAAGAQGAGGPPTASSGLQLASCRARIRPPPRAARGEYQVVNARSCSIR